MRKSLVLIFVFFCFPVLISYAAIIHVPADEPNIQAGIYSAVDGDTVLIADGTYTGYGNRDITIQGKTISIMSVNGSAGCILDLQGTEEDFHHGFQIHFYPEPGIVSIQGLTIRNGFTSGYGPGGAVFCEEGSLTLSDCVIENHAGDMYGSSAVVCADVNLVITDCIFRGNISDSALKIWIAASGNFTVVNSVFEGNVASEGAAIAVHSDQEGTILNCIFTANHAEDIGGAIQLRDSSSPLIDGCQFNNNTAESSGGGIMCRDSSNPTITNSTFSGNSAYLYGGGIAFSDGASSIIGGSPGAGNYFIGNYAASGADISGNMSTATSITASHNTFAGIHYSDYYIAPQDKFDLTGCISETVPITEDVYVSPLGDNNNDGLSWATAFQTIHHAYSQVFATALNPVTIHLAVGEYSYSVTGEIFPLPMMPRVALSGVDQTSTIINAEGIRGCILAVSDQMFEIRNLTVTGGHDSGIRCIGDSIPVITGCTITGNWAAIGGGLFITDSSAGSIIDCLISSNSGWYNAGGVWCYNSNITLVDCIISGNTTLHLPFEETSGGGLVFKDTDTAEITDCLVSGNISSDGDGGGIVCDNASPLISTCVISDNTAIVNSPYLGFADGGAGIACINGSAPVIDKCSIVNNICGSVDSIRGGGGAIFCDGSSPVISNCTIEGNRAVAGGGILCINSSNPVITGSDFNGNYADLLGGGIYTDISSVPIIDGSAGNSNSFDQNRAPGGMDIASESSVSTINARYNSFSGIHTSDYYVTPQEAFDLTGCTSDQSPITQDIYVSTGGNNANDGLSWATSFLTLDYALSRVGAAETNPISIYLNAGLFSPDTTGEIFPLPALDWIQIQGVDAVSTILDAQSETMHFFGYADTDLTFNNLTMTGGNSVYPGGAFTGLNGSAISMTDCVISGNTAQDGGAVFIDRSSATLTSCTISDNTSQIGGGGLAGKNSSEIRIYNCSIKDNTNNHDHVGGGGIYSRDSALTVSDSRIHHNSSGRGGGITVNASSVALKNTVVYQNISGASGAGVYFRDGTTGAIQNCSIIENTSGHDSGGINLDNSDPVIENSIIWFNSHENILVSSSTPVVSYSNIQGGYVGPGNIDADPIFVSGPLGLYYLSQIDAGQNEDSPCLDAGNDLAENICFDGSDGPVCMDELTTRSDSVYDSNLVDMGFHYGYSGLPTVTPTQTPATTPTPTQTPTITWTPTNTPTITPTPHSPGLVIWVPQDYLTIQGAINASIDSDTVMISDGTYLGNGNRDLVLEGKAIIITSQNGPESCVINCQGSETDSHWGIRLRNIDSENSVLSGITIKNSWGDGGAVQIQNASPTIINNIIVNNTAEYGGAGIGFSCGSSPRIENNFIAGNIGGISGDGGKGGGISGYDIQNNSLAIIVNNLFVNNAVVSEPGNNDVGGGAIALDGYADAIIMNNTLNGNYATYGSGGGILCASHTEPIIMNNIITNCVLGEGIFVSIWGLESNMNHNLFWDNYDDYGGAAVPGPNDIYEDPLFITDPLRTYYLSQIDSGQLLDSPCLDAGSDYSQNICVLEIDEFVCLDSYTTRTDGVIDQNIVDLGFHYPTGLSCFHTGDSDGNGTLSAYDAQLAFIIGLNFIVPTNLQNCAADCNGNGIVTVADAAAILNAVLGYGSCVDELPEWSKGK